MAEIVTLKYDDDMDVSQVMDFSAFSVNLVDVELERVIHHRLNGGYEDDTVGYRFTMQVDFEPLGDEKVPLFFLYAFMIGKNRVVEYDLPGVGVQSRSSVPDGELQFTF